MLKTIKTLIAAAALSGTVGANVQAATLTVQEGDNPTPVVENNGNWNYTITDRINPEVPTTEKKDDVQVSVLQEKELKNIISDLINPGIDVNTNHTVAINPVKLTAPVVATPHLTLAAVPANAAETSPAPAVVASAEPVVTNTVPVVSKPSPAPAKAAAAPVAAAQPTPEPKKAEAPAPVKPTPDPKAAPAPAPADNGKKVVYVKATAYTASCEGCSGITRTGVNIKDNPNEKVIAVDPNVIPLGSKVYVEGFGEATAADTGGAIKGNRIDIFIPSEKDALKFGVKHLKVTILD